MKKKRVSTTLVTDQHVIRGYVPAQGERLLEILNSQGTGFVHLEDAEIHRRCGDSHAHTIPRAVLRKASIALALRTDDTHEAPQKRADTLVSRNTHSAFVVVGGYDVAGTVHLRGHADGVNILTLDFARFFPISDAVVTYGGDQRQPIAAKVAIVNRDFVSLFHVEDGVMSKDDLSQAVQVILEDDPRTKTEWTSPLGLADA